MSKQQEINKIEERANELVTNLEQLNQQVASYKSAKDELQNANAKLLALVESTQKLSEESHKIIAEIQKISSAKIFNKLKLQLIILSSGFGVIIILQIVLFILAKK